MKSSRDGSATICAPRWRCLLSILLAAAFALPACGRFGGENEKKHDETSEEKEDAVLVRVVTPERGRLSARLVFTADVEALDRADVFPKVDGIVEAVHFEEGQHVEKGEVLAELESRQQAIERDVKKLAVREAALAAEAATKALAEARTQCGACDDRVAHEQRLLTRAREQQRRNIVALQDVEMAEYNFEQAVNEKERLDATVSTRQTDVASAKLRQEVAKTNLAAAELSLEWTKVRATMSGRITKQHLRLGQKASPAMAAFSLADLDSLVVIPEISQIELRRLRTDLDAELLSSAHTDRTFRGKVEFISPEVDRASGSVKVRIRTEKSDPPLLPGMFVSGHIVTDSRDDILLLPKKALLFDGDRPYVYVIGALKDGERRARQVFIERGLEDAANVECVRTLDNTVIDDTARIAIVGLDRLKDGALIKLVSDLKSSSEDSEKADGAMTNGNNDPSADETSREDG